MHAVIYTFICITQKYYYKGTKTKINIKNQHYAGIHAGTVIHSDIQTIQDTRTTKQRNVKQT